MDYVVFIVGAPNLFCGSGDTQIGASTPFCSNDHCVQIALQCDIVNFERNISQHHLLAESTDQRFQ